MTLESNQYLKWAYEWLECAKFALREMKDKKECIKNIDRCEIRIKWVEETLRC